MTDTCKLEALIKENGYTKKFIAKSLNISEQSLYNKINNATEFTQSEIGSLMSLLSIHLHEMRVIFFN